MDFTHPMIIYFQYKNIHTLRTIFFITVVSNATVIFSVACVFTWNTASIFTDKETLIGAVRWSCKMFYRNLKHHQNTIQLFYTGNLKKTVYHHFILVFMIRCSLHFLGWVYRYIKLCMFCYDQEKIFINVHFINFK